MLCYSLTIQTAKQLSFRQLIHNFSNKQILLPVLNSLLIRTGSLGVYLYIYSALCNPHLCQEFK